MRFNTAFLLLALVSVLMAAQPASSVQTSGSSIDISIAKYEPLPAEPARYVDVWLMAENTGDSDSSEVFVEFTQNFPFSVGAGGNTTGSFGTIPAHSSVVKKFRFVVDANAPQGAAHLDIKYSRGEIELKKTLELQIRTREALLSVASAKTDPEEVEAGSKAKVIMALENLAGTPLQDIVVRLDFSGKTFSPLDSVSERRLYQLLPQEKTTMVFDVISDPSAESGVYRIPVMITYADASGSNYTKSGLVGVILNSPPELDTNIETKDALLVGIAQNVVFSVSNTGPSKVKFLSLTLMPANYTIIGRAKEYLGNLDPDDFETAEFKVFLPKDSGKADFKIRLDYRDAFNKDLSETRTLSVPIYSEAQLSGFGMGTQSGYGTTLLVLLALLTAYYFFRRSKKKRA